MESKLRRGLAVVASSLALATIPLVAASPASADETEPGDVITDTSSGGWCHYSNRAWGGTFYCNSNVKIKLPNGHWQAFVIGTNHGAYTQWSSSSGLSGWKHLDNGYCTSPGNHSMDVWDVHGWAFNVTCIGMDGRRYYDHRYANGSWSGWSTRRI
ncbi:hypothetical protein AB0K89_10760 [Streptomyces cinnamoneus]|uniref:hypothetical protein n=1 Tax=Streptomyces cinnamoneus TaxID=53446 RepID=UPI0034468F4D